MNRIIKNLCTVLYFYFVSSLSSLIAQTPDFSLNTDGTCNFLSFSSCSIDTVHFNKKSFTGPSLALNGENVMLEKKKTNNSFQGNSNGVAYTLSYTTKNESFCIRVSCKNKNDFDMKNIQLSLCLGINTAMKTYPEWRSVYFPTLMKCEKSHFWGYLMNPNGSILTIASPDPIASYRLQYNNSLKNFSSGHLIHSVNLDLLNPNPLPEEHPSNCSVLKKGEVRNWQIYLTPAKTLSDVPSIIHQKTKAPFIESPLYTIKDGDDFILKITSQKKAKVTLYSPNQDKKIIIPVKKKVGNQYIYQHTPKQGEGVYKVIVSSEKKISHGWMSVRHSWNEYIKAARQAAFDYPQKASSHTESWYGFFSAYSAKQHFPSADIDEKIERLFDEIYPLMYDTETYLPSSWHDRIQNHALMASLFVARYKASKNTADLHAASTLADYLLTKQDATGAYKNREVHYTSVIYIAKAIMEVMEQEKNLAKDSEIWGLNYQRHYVSVKKSMDELVLNLDNIQTEGENTFEDGMIACSYTQLAMFALLQPEGSTERAKYLTAAQHFAEGHRCLSQLLIPDSRVNGASIRFWESQYDILTYPNFVNSPHGWSAWRIYGLKYLYQLTGEEHYLTGMMNALGSCAQLLNPKTGILNWAFVSDPYVDVKYFVENENQKGKGKHIEKVIGREYLPMISDWYRAPKNTWVTGYWDYDGGCCDNDVHEIFKCIDELALTSAYFHVRKDGTYLMWNCTVNKIGNKIIIKPTEDQIKTLHTNSEENINTTLKISKVSCLQN